MSFKTQFFIQVAAISARHESAIETDQASPDRTKAGIRWSDFPKPVASAEVMTFTLIQKGSMMKSLLQLITFTSGVMIFSLASAQSQPQSQSQSYTGESLSKSEARQLSQDSSPKARSQLARREAYAAYNEAMSACKNMDRIEKKSCTSDAKANLRSDLAYAKEILAETNTGSSTTVSGTEQSGSMTSTSAGSSGASVADISQQSSGMSGSIGSEPTTSAEKKQLVQDFSPKAQYNLAKREAQAAYSEALAACKSLPKAERSPCNKEARATLQSDLAHAKSRMQQTSSGSTGNGLSGSSPGR